MDRLPLRVIFICSFFLPLYNVKSISVYANLVIKFSSITHRVFVNILSLKHIIWIAFVKAVHIKINILVILIIHDK